jgi:hypothetical protein
MPKDQSKNPPADQNSRTSLRIFDQGDKLVIVRPWFTKNTIKFSICAVIGSIMLVYRPTGQTAGDGGVPIAVYAILGIFTAFASYYSLAGWLNTSVVFVEDRWVRVRHRPIPWLGS